MSYQHCRVILSDLLYHHRYPSIFCVSTPPFRFEFSTSFLPAFDIYSRATMLLQKTSLRIKHFVSPKKNSSLDKSGNCLDDGRFPKNRLPTSNPKRLSWLSQTSSSDSPPLRRASSNATTRSHRLNQSNSTGHSSVTSLCSCDCEANQVPIEHALFGVESPPPLPEILYLPPTSSEDVSPDAKAWRLIFQEPFSRPLTPSALAAAGNDDSFDHRLRNRFGVR